jgi:hypothetical protein
VSVNRSNGIASSKEATPVSTSEEAGAQDRSVVVVDDFLVSPKQEAEHDGYYFIKVRIKFNTLNKLSLENSVSKLRL